MKQLRKTVPTKGDKEEGGIRRKCTYEKGGLCHLHGPGAVCKWKPVIKTEMGEGGIIVRKKSREYFWVCENGREKRQTKLSFVQTQLSSRKLTPEDTSKTLDTKQGGRILYELPWTVYKHQLALSHIFQAWVLHTTY